MEALDIFALIPHYLSESGNIQNIWATCKLRVTMMGVLKHNRESWTELGEIELGFDPTQL